MKFYLLFFCLPLALIRAESADGLKSVDSPFRLKALSIYEKADQRWEEFQAESDWFLKTRAEENTFESENEFERSLHHKLSEEHKEFIQAYREAQEKFLEFRDKLGYLLSLSGSGHYADCASATVNHEITNWFTQYIEKHIFPFNWEISYLSSKGKDITKSSHEPK